MITQKERRFEWCSLLKPGYYHIGSKNIYEIPFFRFYEVKPTPFQHRNRSKLFPLRNVYEAPLLLTSAPSEAAFYKFRPLCTATAATEPVIDEAETLQPMKHSILLERLRQRHLKTQRWVAYV